MQYWLTISHITQEKNNRRERKKKRRLLHYYSFGAKYKLFFITSISINIIQNISIIFHVENVCSYISLSVGSLTSSLHMFQPPSQKIIDNSLS